MSAALSRRAGRVADHPPILGAPPEVKLELARRTANHFTECAAPSYYPPLTELSTDDSLELLALVNRREGEEFQ
jgi:hypothetical protein